MRDASTCVEGAHGQWIWNGESACLRIRRPHSRPALVHLDAYTSDEHFDSLYTSKYTQLLSKARSFAQRTGAVPERTLVIISCGMDACEHEHPGMQRHGKSVPVAFYARFARDAAALATGSGAL